MTRYALIATLMGCLGLGASLFWVSGQRDSAQSVADVLRAELTTAEQRLNHAAQAAAVHRAYIDRIQVAAAKAAEDEAAVMTMEGADAPLPDYLRDILDRLR
ncbi:hypothetical protein EOK75_14120 (plasmid) [Pseudorhodobacter turbinis]|uniref:Uncharacterized protein n=1 Tax=Pseudorhodobacter turbinis TaxID=2500533 RepID=A0A4P8EJB9_9RHOB|nr:hypothetical protein [Pseudorhodobacter turbinis]QCO56933.1 hypothetical protein EOK75_14120 [Pseudorhodobacter turbinis]